MRQLWEIVQGRVFPSGDVQHWRDWQVHEKQATVLKRKRKQTDGQMGTANIMTE